MNKITKNIDAFFQKRFLELFLEKQSRANTRDESNCELKNFQANLKLWLIKKLPVV